MTSHMSAVHMHSCWLWWLWRVRLCGALDWPHTLSWGKWAEMWTMDPSITRDCDPVMGSRMGGHALAHCSLHDACRAEVYWVRPVFILSS